TRRSCSRSARSRSRRCGPRPRCSRSSRWRTSSRRCARAGPGRSKRTYATSGSGCSAAPAAPSSRWTMTEPQRCLLAVGGPVSGLWLLVPLLFGIARLLGLYAIVEERRCRVYVLFGKVLAVLDEPGLHFLPSRLGPAALVMNWLGRCYVLDMRMDQEYLRSTPVNSEEGAPMGIGIWYEMFVGDPVAYLFKNADPRGSLAANVGS